MLVGGADVEMTEPRLNEAVLRRIAETTGGRYVPAREAGTVAGADLAERCRQPADGNARLVAQRLEPRGDRRVAGGGMGGATARGAGVASARGARGAGEVQEVQRSGACKAVRRVRHVR